MGLGDAGGGVGSLVVFGFVAVIDLDEGASIDGGRRRDIAALPVGRSG